MICTGHCESERLVGITLHGQLIMFKDYTEQELWQFFINLSIVDAKHIADIDKRFKKMYESFLLQLLYYREA